MLYVSVAEAYLKKASKTFIENRIFIQRTTIVKHVFATTGKMWDFLRRRRMEKKQLLSLPLQRAGLNEALLEHVSTMVITRYDEDELRKS